MAPRLIAAVGSGGKTTSLCQLAAAASHQPVLLTTTTHIGCPPPLDCQLLRDPSAAALCQALAQPGVVCAGTSCGEGKLSSLPQPVLDAGRQAAGLTLCEADGSRQLPLKLHRPDEPVLPPDTGLCLVVAGLSALGQTVAQAVHRYTLCPAWERNPGQVVGVEEFLYCLRETVRACALPRESIRVLLNQADALADPSPAAAIQASLEREGLSCRTASLQHQPQLLASWLLP